MGINDSLFPGGVVGDHLASVAGGWEPQRAYNWVLSISGIGQSGGGNPTATGVLGNLGGAIGGAIGGAVGNAIGGAIGSSIGSSLGIAGGASSASGVIELALDSSALPTMSMEEIELNFLNTTRYVAGRAKYEPLPLTLKDMVDVGVASAMKTWYEQVFDPRTHKVGLAKDYKKVADLILFAPDGSLERVWRMYGVWPMAVAYGNLDMNSSEKVLIESTLRYDRAVATNF